MNDGIDDDEVLVRIERSEGWATLVLDRPHRKNALTGPMMDQLTAAVTSLSEDTSVAAIVIRGEDGALCSGVDLTELQFTPQHAWVPHFGASVRAAHIALFNCACPIVVALERYGINAGTALALSGDLVIAGEKAFLQIGEIRQGAHIPMNAAWMRIKSNEHVLARMALLGDRVAGPELLRLGLAHEVVPDDQVRNRAEELAAQLAGFPDQSSRNIKHDLRTHLDIDPETWFTSTPNSALMSAEQVRG
jgi:enoyl-CoA hydratase/carnithine racemase